MKPARAPPPVLRFVAVVRSVEVCSAEGSCDPVELWVMYVARGEPVFAAKSLPFLGRLVFPQTAGKKRCGRRANFSTEFVMKSERSLIEVIRTTQALGAIRIAAFDIITKWYTT